MTREVDRIRRGLLRVAHHHVIDGGGIEATALDGGSACDDAEVGGGERLQRAAERTEAGACAAEQDNFWTGHVGLVAGQPSKLSPVPQLTQ